VCGNETYANSASEIKKAVSVVRQLVPLAGRSLLVRRGESAVEMTSENEIIAHRFEDIYPTSPQLLQQKRPAFRLAATCELELVVLTGGFTVPGCQPVKWAKPRVDVFVVGPRGGNFDELRRRHPAVQPQPELKGRVGRELHISEDSVAVGSIDKDFMICRIEGLREQPSDRQIYECFGWAKSVTHYSCVTFSVDHTDLQRISSEEFMGRIEVARKKFGFLVSNFSEYQKDNSERLGHVVIEVLDDEAAATLAKELRKSFPVEPAPEAVHIVPPDEIAIARQLRKWRLDRDVLVVPKEEEKDFRNELFRWKQNDGDRLCFWVCRQPDFTASPIFVFHPDGGYHRVHLCRSCLRIVIEQQVSSFFDVSTGLMDMDKLPRQLDPVLPNIVPVIWAMLESGLGRFARAWVHGAVESGCRRAVTYCPNHPQFPLIKPPRGENMQCQRCEWFLCAECGVWTDLNHNCDMGEIVGAKRCPACRIPVVKISGCNRITCRCGKSFCWVCEGTNRIAYNTASECYAHLAAVHGGAWS
jgi:hypothetical protein